MTGYLLPLVLQQVACERVARAINAGTYDQDPKVQAVAERYDIGAEALASMDCEPLYYVVERLDADMFTHHDPQYVEGWYWWKCDEAGVRCSDAWGPYETRRVALEAAWHDKLGA